MMLCLLSGLVFTGCIKTKPVEPDAGGAGKKLVDTTVTTVTAQIRENLGITFAPVVMRRVGSHIWVPGRFEPRPSAIREYRAPVAGRVDLLVNQYAEVTTGTPLYTLDSAEWRRMQQDYINVQAEVWATSATLMTAQVASEGGAAAADVIHARIAAAEAHIESVQASVESAQKRLEKGQRLQELVGGRMSEVNDARAQLNSIRSELTQAKEDRAELEQQRLQLSTENSSAFGTTTTLRASAIARQAEYDAARARRDLLLQSLLAIGESEDPAGVEPRDSGSRWQIQPFITVYAAAEGTVNVISATSGAYVDASSPVISTVNPALLRFRAIALQSDLEKLHPEMQGKILKPSGEGAYDKKSYIPVSAHVALEADPDKRTLDVVADVATTATWARAGVSTNLELLVEETSGAKMAIPVDCIIQDGLDMVFYRRDKKNPDLVRRTKADLGLSDGEYVELITGAKVGDQVVKDGVYELKLSTSALPPGAHVHSDGTVHMQAD